MFAFLLRNLLCIVSSLIDGLWKMLEKEDLKITVLENCLK
jgi:hypothetical protein